MWRWSWFSGTPRGSQAGCQSWQFDGVADRLEQPGLALFACPACGVGFRGDLAGQLIDSSRLTCSIWASSARTTGVRYRSGMSCGRTVMRTSMW